MNSGVQILTQWTGLDEDMATWEDLDELRAKFPAAPAWGQADTEERGNVTIPNKHDIGEAMSKPDDEAPEPDQELGGRAR
jgi:hypothetical protein